jgi:hypothetical protein
VNAGVQPSSCAAERVFSMLNSAQSEDQRLILKNYLETCLMLSFNAPRRKRTELEAD